MQKGLWRLDYREFNSRRMFKYCWWCIHNYKYEKKKHRSAPNCCWHLSIWAWELRTRLHVTCRTGLFREKCFHPETCSSFTAYFWRPLFTTFSKLEKKPNIIITWHMKKSLVKTQTVDLRARAFDVGQWHLLGEAKARQVVTGRVINCLMLRSSSLPPLQLNSTDPISVLL